MARIAEAKRPIAVIGTSAMRMQDPGLLQAFIEKHQMPFATTTMSKGLIDDDHPLAIGCIERGLRQMQRKFIRTCDLIVGLGRGYVVGGLTTILAWPLVWAARAKGDEADRIVGTRAEAGTCAAHGLPRDVHIESHPREVLVTSR